MLTVHTGNGKGRRSIVLASAEDPIRPGDDDDDAERGNTIIHVDRVRGVMGRPDEQEGGKKGPGDISEIAEIPEPLGDLEIAIFRERTAATQHVDAWRNGVGDSEADDGC